ncbi:MAG: hypothetical protein QOI95_2311 [Acidimicrobiaceae bacterium]|jgi:hypothetical protein
MIGDPDDVYDDATWDAVDRWHVPARRVPAEVASGWRAGLGATALMTAAALGVQDVLEPKRHAPIIEEIDLDTLGPSERAPVVYHHVPGAPRASRAVVRLWLLC